MCEEGGPGRFGAAYEADALEDGGGLELSWRNMAQEPGHGGVVVGVEGRENGGAVECASRCGVLKLVGSGAIGLHDEMP